MKNMCNKYSMSLCFFASIISVPYSRGSLPTNVPVGCINFFQGTSHIRQEKIDSMEFLNHTATLCNMSLDRVYQMHIPLLIHKLRKRDDSLDVLLALKNRKIVTRSRTKIYKPLEEKSKKIKCALDIIKLSYELKRYKVR